MTLKPEEQKRVIKMYLAGETIQDIAKETGRAWHTINKYVEAAKTELEARPVPHLDVTTIEIARTSALDEIQIPIDYLIAVLNNPFNQMIGVKAADVLARVLNVKASITGERAPLEINKRELHATVDLTKEFRDFMDGD
ncbi:TPA_asm: hypothetical protein vir520_00046 [Caudoviricetes sp. vir520]|nr:TPA_asm: hypothetical protein vir520_00046 [Caudoviricetes sp. vir520]